MRLGLQHIYSALPSRFYARIAPVPAKNPQLIVFNSRLAEELDSRVGRRKEHLTWARVRITPFCKPLVNFGAFPGVIGRAVAWSTTERLVHFLLVVS
jgi:hypothetical protein